MSSASIREVQLVELEMLKAIVELCKKHQIRYSLYCGTLLGAIRHRGFIPWDDDVDLVMPLSDYRRFLEVADELPDEYVVRSPSNDPHALYNWAKVFANGTTVMPVYAKSIATHWGVSIDVYPMIGEAKTKVGAKLQYGLLELSRRLKLSEQYRCELKHGLAGSGKMYFGKRVSELFPLGLLQSLGNLLFKISLIDPARSNHIGTVDAAPFRGKYLKCDWTEMTTAPFEGYEFSIPAEYDKILRIMYGDYMKLPPEEDRKLHYEDKGEVIRDVNRDYREYSTTTIGR